MDHKFFKKLLKKIKKEKLSLSGKIKDCKFLLTGNKNATDKKLNLYLGSPTKPFYLYNVSDKIFKIIISKFKYEIKNKKFKIP